MPSFPESLEGGAVVLDFLITAGQSKLDLLCGHGIAFHARNGQARRCEIRLDSCQCVQILLSSNFAQLARDTYDSVINTHLAGKFESRVLMRLLYESQFYPGRFVRYRSAEACSCLAGGARQASCG